MTNNNKIKKIQKSKDNQINNNNIKNESKNKYSINEKERKRINVQCIKTIK